jgi:hypothetical protein
MLRLPRADAARANPGYDISGQCQVVCRAIQDSRRAETSPDDMNSGGCFAPIIRLTWPSASKWFLKYLSPSLAHRRYRGQTRRGLGQCHWGGTTPNPLTPLPVFSEKLGTILAPGPQFTRLRSRQKRARRPGRRANHDDIHHRSLNGNVRAVGFNQEVDLIPLHEFSGIQRCNKLKGRREFPSNSEGHKRAVRGPLASPRSSLPAHFPFLPTEGLRTLSLAPLSLIVSVIATCNSRLSALSTTPGPSRIPANSNWCPHVSH